MRAVKKVLVSALIAAAVLAFAVVAIVWALNQFSSGGPLTARCIATVGDLPEQRLDPDQADNAALIAAISAQRELPARAATIGIATAMQESKLRNIDYGDRDSLGLFQQRPSQGWGTEDQVQDPRYATEAFFDVLARIEGYNDMPVTDAAQAVQRSAFPDAYAQHEKMARAFASALTGYSPAALNCRLHPAQSSDIAGFQERLAADFPQAHGQSGSQEVSIKTGTVDDGSRQLWAIANWSVALAQTYGIDSVTVAGQEWSRNQPWEQAQDAADEPGVVRVIFAH